MTIKIFISHASENGSIAQQIEKWIHETFLGGVNVFCSSGGGLSPGDNWKEEIFKNLNSGDISLVLCSENSLKKLWLGFEAGAMWKKGARIVPLCFHGVSKSDLPEPFRTFQGLNIEFKEDLKDLIDLIAEFSNFDKSLIKLKELKITPQQIKDSTEIPDFRVTIGVWKLGNQISGFRDVVILTGKNFSQSNIFLSQGIGFENLGEDSKYIGIFDDFLTGQPFPNDKVEPGQSVQRFINPKNLIDGKCNYGRAFFSDEIDRYYFTPEGEVESTIERLKEIP